VIRLTGEHPSELQIRNPLFEIREFLLDSPDRGLVILFNRHLQQLAGIRQTGGEFIDGDHNLLETGTFATQGLGPFLIIPYRWILQFAQNLSQALLLGFIVKDTP
jgi:hypothetical protein